MRKKFLVVLLVSSLLGTATACGALPDTCDTYKTCSVVDASTEDAQLPESGLRDANRDATDTSVEGSSDASDGDAASPDGTVPCGPTMAPSTNPCVVDEKYGVFVAPAPTGNDTSGDGTRLKPFASLVKAAVTAKASGRPNVFQCAATYVAAANIDATADGIKAYGGLDCATWQYTGAKAIVAPTLPGPALTINSLAIGFTFEDFEFDGTRPDASGSSFSTLVSSSKGVTFRRCVLTAGDAQKGSDGAGAVNSWSGDAQKGNDANTSFGGLAQKQCTCGGTGGYGGNAGTYNSSTFVVLQPGADGDNGSIGTLVNKGTGAKQGSPAPTIIACTPGQVGGTGAVGIGGAGGTGNGSLASTGWTNPTGSGADGAGSGGAGQGGGGAGGGLYDPANPPNGGGAGGGCGGCGGAAGKGGKAGGSSIALTSFASKIVLDSCVLTAGAGGQGGRGGDGGAGQTGGASGQKASVGGCTGGAGGNGGGGGAGGGGAGGSSIAIAFAGGSAPTEIGTVTKNVAVTPASGGQPGSGAAATNGAGAQGTTAPVQSF